MSTFKNPSCAGSGGGEEIIVDTITSPNVDDSGVVGTTFDTPDEYTGDAKLLEGKNNGVSKWYIDANGAYTQVDNWVSYTPTGSWSTNMTYVGKYVVINKTVFCYIELDMTGAPLGVQLTDITLPIPIATTKLTSTSTNLPIGSGAILKAEIAHYPNIQALYKTSTTFEPVYPTVSLVSGLITAAAITTSAPINVASDDKYFFFIQYPIA